ncbi:hypothetical protein BK140_28155 [Paenibacillus macerans]|nr:hypothetical protein BK140_28155 [Paenibacillus macerans]
MVVNLLEEFWAIYAWGPRREVLFFDAGGVSAWVVQGRITLEGPLTRDMVGGGTADQMHGKCRRLLSKQFNMVGSNAKMHFIYTDLIKIAPRLHYQMHFCISSL